MLYPIIIILSLVSLTLSPVRGLVAKANPFHHQEGNVTLSGSEGSPQDSHSQYLKESSWGDTPDQYNNELSAAYLQKAYHSINQTFYYIELSEKSQQLPLFDYAQLRHDLERIKGELGKYLYPEQKDHGEAVKVTIDGQYFLEGIKDAASPPERQPDIHPKEEKH